MAGVLTAYGASQFLSATLNHDLWIPPTSLYLCVCLSTPPSNADGTDLDEPDLDPAYARYAYPVDSTAWAPTGGGEMFNTAQAALPAMTVLAGLAMGWAMTDAVTIGGGNVWAVGPVAEPYMLDVGVIPFFDVGDITISLAAD